MQLIQTTQPLSVYVPRGDVASMDTSVISFTVDGNWHDWDISAIIGTGRRLVHLFGIVLSTDGQDFIQFRPKGEVNGINVAMFAPTIAMQSLNAEMMVMSNASGVLEYMAYESGGILAADFVVRGYWK